MGCNNSHLRPLFRRCRRRRSKKDEPSITPKVDLERNGSQDLLQGVQLLGASLRNNSTTSITTTTTALTVIKSTTDNPSTTSDSSAFCVPLLAQSEASLSQLDFFKMLDQKIEEGPDYESEDEHERLNYHFSLPALRLESTKERKSMISTQGPLKFTNWNWDEDGD